MRTYIMPKRKCSDDKEEKWRNKIKKYQEKLTRKRYHEFWSADEQEFRDEPSPRSWPPLSPARSLASVAIAPRIPLEGETQADRPTSTPPVTASCLTEPSKSATVSAPKITEAEDSLPADPELLLALGTFEAESSEWGPNISEDLTKRWEPILKDGLKKEVKEELFKKYPVPKNCPLVMPPVLNPEIRIMLNESARNRDTRFLKKQDHLACALTVLGKTMSDMLTKSIEMPAILANLSDASKMIASSHYLETDTRRSLVTPMVDKTFIEPFKDRKRDSHLFGEKLSDFIKSSRCIQKTGKLLQSTVSSASNLNLKPAPPRGQPSYCGQRYQNRGGGVKASTSYRRRPTAYQQSSTRSYRPSTPPPTTSQHHTQSGTLKRKQ